ncbi:MAG: N-acetylmuramoyl-L-alanine amidase [Elusimicrobiota bacterium]
MIPIIKGTVYFFLFLFPSLLFASPLRGKIIVIDAGHGTINSHGNIINSGKVNHRGIERKINLEISQKLGEFLKKEGAQVFFTRTEYDYWRINHSIVEDNQSRAFLANQLNADALLSIHCDWDPRPKVSGVTTLYYTPQSESLAHLVQGNLVKKTKSKNRKVVNEDFTILEYAKMPAIIIETGFLSNKIESKKIKNPEHQTKIVKAISLALKSYFSK